LPGESHRLPSVGRFPDHAELRPVLEKPTKAVSDDRMIVRDDHADRAPAFRHAIASPERISGARKISDCDVQRSAGAATGIKRWGEGGVESSVGVMRQRPNRGGAVAGSRIAYGFHAQ